GLAGRRGVRFRPGRVGLGAAERVGARLQATATGTAALPGAGGTLALLLSVGAAASVPGTGAAGLAEVLELLGLQPRAGPLGPRQHALGPFRDAQVGVEVGGTGVRLHRIREV